MNNQGDKPGLVEMKEKIRKKAYTGFLIDTPRKHSGESMEKALFDRGFDAAWEYLASLDDEPLKCDVCGQETDDPWHYSGGDSRHLHACDDCKDKVIFR